MARNKNIRREPQTRRTEAPAAKAAIWKRPWLWLTGALAAVALLLTNLTSILTDARGLPGEFEKTSDQFWQWYGKYEAWKGYWTSSPEGDVTVGDLQLSDAAFLLEIDTEADGTFAGWIETPGICDKVPFFETLMIDGTISSASRAEANVWDSVGGQRRVFARIALERDGEVITVRPIEDPAGIFPKATRIGRDPGNVFGEHEENPICPDKAANLIERALKKMDQPAEATPAPPGRP